MARILLVLAAVLLLLNGMTFLLVVNQGSSPDKSAVAATAAPHKGSTGVDPQAQKLEQISQGLQTLQKSMGDLSRKVDDVQRKVQLNATRSIPAPTPAPPATGAVAPASAATAARAGARSIPPVRTGPTEMSTPGVGRKAEAQSEAEGDVEDDNTADHAPPASRKIPAPTDSSTPNGNGEGNSIEGNGTEAQPAETGGTGTPSEGAEQPQGQQ